MLRVRHSSGKLSLSTTGPDGKDGGGARVELPRTSKRFGPDSSHGRSNPFNAISPLSGGVSSPSTNASSAFGLGSGAFASFGAPKNSGLASDTGAVKTPGEKREMGGAEQAILASMEGQKVKSPDVGTAKEHSLKATWVVWYRPPTPKYSDYEKSTIPLASISSVESFWSVYSHLKRPSLLPTVSDYHIFKKGIRPVWEDEANKKGGKWIVRFKKGVADRYWEDLLFAIVGDQFAEAADEVCGAVLSVRSGEDVLSIWTRIDGGRNIKIRYAFPLPPPPSIQQQYTNMPQGNHQTNARLPIRHQHRLEEPRRQHCSALCYRPSSPGESPPPSPPSQPTPSRWG